MRELVAKRQKPAENEIQKIREIDGSYLYLQRFDKFWICSPETEAMYLNLKKLA